MNSQAPSLTEVDGVSIVKAALDYAGKKSGARSAGEVVASINQGDLETYLYFRYGLAKEAARQIAETSGCVDAALVFLENRCESIPGDPVLMGLLVPRKSAALEALVEVVCEAVKREAANSVPALAGFDAVLTVEILDPEQVSHRRGLGALVGSISEPPIQVWPQE